MIQTKRTSLTNISTGGLILPIANNNTTFTNHDEGVIIDVLANDSDPAGGTLTIFKIEKTLVSPTNTVTLPSGNEVTLNANQTLTFTPDSGYYGTDTFKYYIKNSKGGTAVATVEVEVDSPPNQPPVANNVSTTAEYNDPTIIDVLANDSDPDGDPLTIIEINNSPINVNDTITLPSGNEVTLNTNQTLTFTPISFSGNDSFDYTISDGQGGTDTAVVTIDVSNPPDLGLLAVSSDGSPTILIYDINNNYSLLPNPTDLPSGGPHYIHFSHNKQYMITGHGDTSSRFVSVYDVNNNFNRISIPSLESPISSINGNVWGIEFTPNDKFIAAAHNNTPVFNMYDVDNNFAEFTNIQNNPTTNGRRLNISPDGNLVVFGTVGGGVNNEPFFVIYDISNATSSTSIVEKIPTPLDGLPAEASGVRFSPDGKLLALSHGGTPSFTVYHIDGTLPNITFTKLASPVDLPAGTGRYVSFNHDGSIMAVAHSSGDRITAYEVNYDGINTTFTKLTIPNRPSFAGNAVEFNSNGSLMAVTSNASPYIFIYSVSGTTFTRLPDPPVLPSSSCQGVRFV